MMAVTGPIAAAVGGSLISGASSYFGAQAQAGAAEQASRNQMAMYQQTRSDLMPYVQGGYGAVNNLSGLLGLSGPAQSASMLQSLQNYPGYQFAFNQGLQGVDRSAAARGLNLSGGQLKDVTQYGQGMADQLFNQYWNQNMGLAGLGENAAAMTGQQGTQAANNAGMFGVQSGTAQASGLMGLANAFSGQNGVLQNSAQLYAMLNQGGGNFDSVNNFNPGQLNFDQSGTLVYSDRRLKKNIRPIGTLDSGLPVYSYEYKGSRLPQMGVLADEVRRVAPHAVRRGRDGYDRVDYRAVSQLPPMKRAA